MGQCFLVTPFFASPTFRSCSKSDWQNEGLKLYIDTRSLVGWYAYENKRIFTTAKILTILVS